METAMGSIPCAVHSALYPRISGSLNREPPTLLAEFCARRAFALKYLQALGGSVYREGNIIDEPHHLVDTRLDRHRRRWRHRVVGGAALRCATLRGASGDAEFARHARPVRVRANQSLDAIGHNPTRPGAPRIANRSRIVGKTRQRRANRHGAAAAILERDDSQDQHADRGSAAGRKRDVAIRADAATW